MTNWRWLVPLAIAGAACTGEGATTQVLEGHLTGSGAIVRAVSGDEIVAAAQVKGDGSWTLGVPRGTGYRLEVVDVGGAVHAVVARAATGAKTLTFDVCKPQQPYDCGGMGDTGSGMGSGGPSMGCDPATDPTCKCDASGVCCDANGNCTPPPPCTDPSDPNCTPPPPKCDPGDPNCMPPPTTCDPATDPTCKCDASGVCCDANGNCTPPPPCTDPSDPSCMPPTTTMCDPTTDPKCTCDAAGNCCYDPNGNCTPPPPCDPSTGANCGCTDPSDPNCMPPPGKCDPTTDPMCTCDAAGNCCYDPNGNCTPPVCDPTTGASCGCTNPDATGACPPACADPNDPSTCKDPCMIDPMTCGCMDGDPNCWPGPQPPPCDPKTGMCDPSGTMAPDHPPGDFGCGDGG